MSCELMDSLARYAEHLRDLVGADQVQGHASLWHRMAIVKSLPEERQVKGLP